MNIKKNLNIATILPYKENYTFTKASAASLWVSEFFKKSKYKKNNIIYGHTKSKDYLSKNYKNINLKNLKSKLKSTTNEYAEKLTKEINNNNFDIVEVHNRPLLLFKLINKVKSKFIFYFHNDPLSMKGSKSVKERLKILENVEKIIFVSEWVRGRFFLDIDQKLQTKTEVVYPSVNKQKKIKKEKNIIFVGRLNYSKGYDIFKDATLKILEKFPRWKAYSIGDEDRRNIYINHPRHKEFGFLNHKKTLNILNRSEIAVVPSRWEEPFGRTSLEATSRGCATIISNKGGLKETTDSAIILKNLSSKELYLEIKGLITNNKKRKTLQTLGRKNIKHLISENTKIIDQIREESVPFFNVNLIKKKLKIINLYNQGQKHNHRLYNISLGKKFTNGFIRNGHDVLEISDRDYIKQSRGFSLTSNSSKFQNYLLNTFKNYSPDLIFFGHTNNLEKETIMNFKEINNNLILSHWNEDPIMPGLEYSKKNISNINRYSDLVDHNFITTHPSVLKKQNINNNNFHFIFIPVDKNIECFDVYNMNPVKDLFYAMSHGVNRGVLKKGKSDNRINFLNKLINKINGINYDFYGFENKDPIWGNEFYKSLINSKMGLNLSRGNPAKYYSSNRIASLVGNGLLTFVDKKTQLEDFFNKNEIIFYNSIEDLAEKIKFYKKNESSRIKIAKNGKRKYFRMFNEQKITKYIIDRSFGKKSAFI